MGSSSGAAPTWGNALTLDSGSGNVLIESGTGAVAFTHALTITTSTGDVTFMADTDITNTSTTNITTSGSGSTNGYAIFDSNAGADLDGSGTGGAIALAGGTIATNGGNITLGGNEATATNIAAGTGFALGNATNVSGINISGGTLNASGGAITMNGQGYLPGAGNSSTDYGIEVHGSATLEAIGSGTITLTGTGGGHGTGFNSYGVYVTSSTVEVVDGALSITGTGGVGTGNSQYGIDIDTGGIVETTGKGAITLTGTGVGNGGGYNNGINIVGTVESTLSGSTAGSINLIGYGGGSGGSGSYNFGICITGGSISSVSGAILLDGNTGTTTGQTVSTPTGGDDYGIDIDTSGTVTSSGTGTNAATITLNGSGGGSVGEFSGDGIYVTNSTVKAVDGALSITGTGGVGTGNGAYGTDIDTGGIVETTGKGTITLTGTGGGSNGGNNNYGINIVGTVESTSNVSTAGSITLIGYGGDTGGSSYNNYGVSLSSGTITSLDGAILIDGNTGTTTGQTITTTTGGSNWGFYYDSGSTISSTGTGVNAATITINGVGGGSGAGSGDYGVELGSYLANSITTVDGNIAITGTGSSSNHGGTSTGIYMGGGTIETTGKRAILLTGTGGSNASDSAGNDPGISIGGTVESTSAASTAGTVTLIGYGGDSGGSGNYNYGVSFSTAPTTVDGNITIDGNTGTTTGQTLTTSSGLFNNGIYLATAITSTGTANITLDSVGENSAKSFLDSGHNTVGGASDTGNITMIQDTATWGGGAAGTDIILQTTSSGTVQVESYSTGAGNTVGVAGGAGNLNIDSTFLGNISAEYRPRPHRYGGAIDRQYLYHLGEQRVLRNWHRHARHHRRADDGHA